MGTVWASYIAPMHKCSTLLFSICYSEDSDRPNLSDGVLKGCPNLSVCADWLITNVSQISAKFSICYSEDSDRPNLSDGGVKGCPSCLCVLID